MVMTSRPAADAVSSDSATEINATLRFLEQFQQTAQVLDGAREPVEFGDGYGIHSAAVHQGEQTLEPGAVQVLGRLPAVHDDLEQLGSLHCGHGANLGFLGLERHARGYSAETDQSFRWETDHQSGGIRSGVGAEAALVFRLCWKVIGFVKSE